MYALDSAVDEAMVIVHSLGLPTGWESSESVFRDESLQRILRDTLEDLRKRESTVVLGLLATSYFNR
jgi:hypothetical protein